MPVITSDPCVQDILTLVVVFVCSYNYIQNPYLTAKLIEIMFVLNPKVQQHTPNVCDMLLNHRLATVHLVPALMNFYTGLFKILPVKKVGIKFTFTMNEYKMKKNSFEKVIF